MVIPLSNGRMLKCDGKKSFVMEKCFPQQKNKRKQLINVSQVVTIYHFFIVGCHYFLGGYNPGDMDDLVLRSRNPIAKLVSQTN